MEDGSMVGNKKISCLLATLLITSVLGGCRASNSSASSKNLQDKKVLKIGITQIVEHPALDSARKGFIDALKSKGYEEGKNIKLDIQNAQGDTQNAQSIANKFVSDKVDLILAVATPTAQAAYNSTKDIPILITAVTDPVQAGLVKSLDKPETNVTGTSDNVPIEKQFELLKKLVPDAKRVGILYNTGEPNSEIQVNNARTAAPSFGLEIVASGITSTNDIPQTLSSIIDKIDVLYVPTDNMVASSMAILSDQCFKNNVPIIGAERGQVENGALATTGIDYYKLGFQTGLNAVEVLNGKSPKEIPVTMLKEMQLVINTDAAKKLNINIPEDIGSKAEKITGGVK
jgi:putative tryptophan/tyrosine transport system substrate-binding protein